MKSIKNSFLFFCFLTTFFCSKHLKAQPPKDSLDHYYNLYIKATESTDFKKVYNFYSRTKEAYLQKKDTLKAIYHIRILASIENKIGQPYNSELTASNGLELLDNLPVNRNTTGAKIGLLNHLGIVYFQLKNYDKALYYYKKVLEIVQSDAQRNVISNNIANTYRKKKNYELAFDEFNELYQRRLKSGNSLKIANTLNNLGLVKSKLNYEGALTDMLEALEIRKKENNVDEIFMSYVYLAEYFSDRNDLKKLEYYANKAYDLAVKAKNDSYKLEALSFLIDNNENSKVLEYKKLNDSITLAKQLNENKFASLKYDFSKEKKEAEQAKLALLSSNLKEEKQKRLKLVFLTIGVIISLTSIFIYFLLKSRHKKEKLSEIYKTETRISEKVHDEVANDIYHVMTKLQNRKNINNSILDDLENVYKKTREISRENSTIDLDTDFNETLKDLLISYKNNSTNVITKNISQVKWEKISKENKRTIYRVLQELMTNMRKHSNASFVLLTFNQNNNKLNIDYKDNGVGCKVMKHSGLRNVENRILTSNGTINFESDHDKGFMAAITI